MIDDEPTDGGTTQFDQPSEHAGGTDESPVAHLVGHVHLKVRSLDRAISFYTAILGLEVRERQGRFAFLSFGDRHHDVALQEVGQNAPGPGRGVGLYHAAFEVESPDQLRRCYERLTDRGTKVAAVDHGISKALYFDDPSGNGLEVYLDTRESNDEYEWQGTTRPFDPRSIEEREPGA